MTTPITIRGKNFDLTPAIKEHIGKRVEKLGKYFDRITSVNVEVRTSQHHQKGFLSCRVNMNVPKHTFHSEETKADLYDAIDSAFSVLERELRRHKEMMQDSRKK